MPEIIATEPMSITAMMDLRKHCKDGESAGICNMSGTMPIILQNGVYGDFADTLKDVVTQTIQFKEDPMALVSFIGAVVGSYKYYRSRKNKEKTIIAWMHNWLTESGVELLLGKWGKGYADIEKGNVEDADSAFAAFRERH